MALNEVAPEIPDADALHGQGGDPRGRAGLEYIDRETGEELEPIAQLLPLAPTASELPWAVENLRFCNHCDQLAQKDLNDCPHCGRRMEPLGD